MLAEVLKGKFSIYNLLNNSQSCGLKGAMAQIFHLISVSFEDMGLHEWTLFFSHS